MISARNLHVRAGARILVDDASFRIGPGDKVGLVGRNGAGKTTMTRILAGEALPAGGEVTRSGSVGYLPQDPRTGDLQVLARDRILSARGLDDVVRRLRKAEHEMGSDDDAARDQAMKRYTQADAELHAAGGFSAEAEAAQIAASLGLPDRVLGAAARHPVRRSAAPGRAVSHPVLGRARPCCSTSRPTTSTPTRSSGSAPSSSRTRAGWS